MVLILNMIFWELYDHVLLLLLLFQMLMATEKVGGGAS